MNINNNKKLKIYFHRFRTKKIYLLVYSCNIFQDSTAKKIIIGEVINI